jgi:hypothetical protein
MRARYFLRFDVEVPAPDLSSAIERALRLFRPRVRAGLRQTVSYQGHYKGSSFILTRLESPPSGRVDLKKRRRKLVRKAAKS